MREMSLTQKARRVAAALAAALALTLTACGADSPGPQTSGDPTSDKTSTTAGTAESQEPAHLVIGTMSAPANLDPAMLYEGQTAYVWSALYDTLLMRDAVTGEIKPNAAEAWEFSEDGLTLTFDIRDGLTFSSGEAITAETVVATLERSRNTPGTQQPNFEAVTSITAEGDQVVIEFDQITSGFTFLMSNATGVIADPATVDDERTITNPVESGPYTLDVEATVPGSTYVMVKREDYWNADAYRFDTITLRIFADPTAILNALQAGEVNAATVNAQMLGPVQGNDDFTIQQVEATTYNEFQILDRAGALVPELNDARVRQAINYAIDREGISAALAPTTSAVTAQLFGPFSRAFVPELDTYYEYDPDRARELLAEAGVSGFTIPIPSSYMTSPLEPFLSQQLGDVGITLDWIPITPAETDGIPSSGKYGATIAYGSFGVPEVSAVNLNFGATQATPNIYVDETVDGYLEIIESTTDQDSPEVVEALQSLNKYVVEQGFTAPIMRIDATWVTRDGVIYLDEGRGNVIDIRTFGFNS